MQEDDLDGIHIVAFAEEEDPGTVILLEECAVTVMSPQLKCLQSPAHGMVSRYVWWLQCSVVGGEVKVTR